MPVLTRQEKAMYEQFMAQFQYCFACHWSSFQSRFRSWCFPRLENAHIVGGAGRRAERVAIVRLCSGCHQLNHGHTIRVRGDKLPRLTLGMMLTIKQEHDPEHFDPARLEQLRGQTLPEPEELAPWFHEQRDKHLSLDSLRALREIA